MILGVDHVALTASDIDADVTELQRAGYSAKFVEKNLPNSREKVSLLRRYTPRHAIAYCRRDKTVAIELVQHDNSLTAGSQGYQVVMGEGAPGTVVASGPEAGIWRGALGVSATETRRWESFNTEFTAAPLDIGIRGVLVWVRNLTKAEPFWMKGLGFRTQDRGQGWVRLTLPSPVPAWALTVVLAEDSKPRPLPLLDDAGFSCLALLTNRIEADMAEAEQAGATDITELFEMTTGGKLLRIGLLRGTDGELVELIEMKRN
jgi:hypothetical protein